MHPLNQALRDAGLSASDLSKVIMVGGSTRIPAVYDAVKKATGKDPYKGINPDECVAIGAAIQAGVLAGEVKDMLLLDVTPLSLGIETLGGVFTKLIDRNTTIPTSKSQIFSTAADHQTSVDIHVLQGERQFARDNKTLGRFELVGIAPAPRGVPQIEVTFDIDANGIVSVKAVDKGTNKSQSITITASSNLSESDIDAAIKDAEKYAEEDEKRRKLVDAKNNAEQFAFVIEKFISENGDKLSDDDKNALNDAIKEARESFEKAEAEEDVRSAMDKLSKVSDPIFSKFYQENPEAAQEAARQAGFDPNNSGGANGTVDDDNMTPPEGGWN
jgi:molecular chaperone DnaK